MSEVMGSGRECQAGTVQERPERSYPASEVRVSGQEELPGVRGQGGRPGGPTRRPRIVAAQAQEGLEELSHVEGQEGWR